jgi:alanyl-tRNA synthetase
MTDEQIDETEEIVKSKIAEDFRVEWFIKPFDEAKNMGATALFGEKYGDTVRVVVTGDINKPFSMELCGGTHVDHTSDIGDFFIIQESAIAAGMRRIEALTGRELKEFLHDQKKIISNIKAYLQKDVAELSVGEISEIKNNILTAHKRLLKKEKLHTEVSRFLEKLDAHQKKQKKLGMKRLSDDASSIKPAAELADGKLVIYVVPAETADDLMVFVDRFKLSHKESTVVTISDRNGGFAITSFDDDSAQAAFNIMKETGNVRGGGKPTIRGAMPKDKIELVIEDLKKKYG